MLLKATRSTRNPKRDKAILPLLLDSGLRVSELAGLEVERIRFENGTAAARVLGKGGRERMVPIGREATRQLGDTWVAAAGGLPLLRHLVMDFQEDPTVFNIEDQFMTGRALLVAPILTKNNSRRIYLPAGIWYDFWTGECIEGGHWITREAHIETIPVYVRGGTILPLADAAQCTDQLRTDRLTLRVYLNAEGRAAGEILDGQCRLSFEARQKQDAAVGVRVPPGVVNSVVELPPGFTRSEVVVKNN